LRAVRTSVLCARCCLEPDSADTLACMSQNRVREHIAAFNHAVQADDWDSFAARFAPDATMEFVGARFGPVHGGEAIAAAYRSDAPDETITIESINSDDDHDKVRFVWSSGSAATMELTWRDGLVRRLSVAFDPTA
jgi:steroid Delta-isomerase